MIKIFLSPSWLFLTKNKQKQAKQTKQRWLNLALKTKNNQRCQDHLMAIGHATTQSASSATGGCCSPTWATSLPQTQGPDRAKSNHKLKNPERNAKSYASQDPSQHPTPRPRTQRTAPHSSSCIHGHHALQPTTAMQQLQQQRTSTGQALCSPPPPTLLELPEAV